MNHASYTICWLNNYIRFHYSPAFYSNADNIKLNHILTINLHVSFIRRWITEGKTHEVEDDWMIRVMIAETSRASQAYISATHLSLKLKGLFHLNTTVTFWGITYATSFRWVRFLGGLVTDLTAKTYQFKGTNTIAKSRTRSSHSLSENISQPNLFSMTAERWIHAPTATAVLLCVQRNCKKTTSKKRIQEIRLLRSFVRMVFFWRIMRWLIRKDSMIWTTIIYLIPSYRFAVNYLPLNNFFVIYSAVNFHYFEFMLLIKPLLLQTLGKIDTTDNFDCVVEYDSINSATT